MLAIKGAEKDSLPFLCPLRAAQGTCGEVGTDEAYVANVDTICGASGQSG
jgi:hypothetical protein